MKTTNQWQRVFQLTKFGHRLVLVSVLHCRVQANLLVKLSCKSFNFAVNTSTNNYSPAWTGFKWKVFRFTLASNKAEVGVSKPFRRDGQDVNLKTTSSLAWGSWTQSGYLVFQSSIQAGCPLQTIFAHARFHDHLQPPSTVPSVTLFQILKWQVNQFHGVWIWARQSSNATASATTGISTGVPWSNYVFWIILSLVWSNWTVAEQNLPVVTMLLVRVRSKIF